MAARASVNTRKAFEAAGSWSKPKADQTVAGRLAAVLVNQVVHAARAAPGGASDKLRDELKQCYRTEGVNYHKECAQIAQAYMSTIKNVGIQKYNAGPLDNVA